MIWSTHVSLRSKARGRSTHLVRRDAVLQARPYAVPRDLAGDKVREPALEADEEVQDGDLEWVRGVRVDFVVGLDDEEAAFLVGVAR